MSEDAKKAANFNIVVNDFDAKECFYCKRVIALTELFTSRTHHFNVWMVYIYFGVKQSQDRNALLSLLGTA